MFSSQHAMLFALAISFQLVKSQITVESVDGSFVPWSFVKRAPEDDLISVRMRNNFDESYLTPVYMGTPPQQLQMAVSLSQNFISVAAAPRGVVDPSYYNAATSSSYTPISGATANLPTLSGGNAVGRFAGEICTLPSGKNDASFNYGASVVFPEPSVNTDLFPSGARAILGYGVKTPVGSPPNASMLPSFLGAQGFTSGTAICGVELNHFDDPFPDGFLTMGAVDSTAFTGDFSSVMVPPNHTISWSIPVDTITFLDSGTNQLRGVAGGLSSVDMYHNTIQVTTDVARQIYSSTLGARPISATEWSIPCNSTFPITLTFGGVPFTIVGRDTVVRKAGGNCTGVITGGARTTGKVGAPFMRNFYTQFSATISGNDTTFAVAFAKKVQRQRSGLSTSSSITPSSSSQPTVASSVTSSPSPTPTPTTGSSVSGARATIYSSPMLLGLMVVSIAVVIFL